MTVRAWAGRALAAMAVVAALAGAPYTGVAAEGDSLMDYGIDLVTTYVSRGNDLHVSVFDKEREAHGVFNVAPAVQPYVTFYAESGLSFGLWGSFAIADRDAEGSFTGLKTVDEIDYTLSYAWDNKLGAFSAGLANYALPDAAGTAGSGVTEVFFSWGLPFAESLGPTLTHYSDLSSSATYTKLGIGGGEAISWAASLGHGVKKLQDITGKVAYAFGSMSVAFNLAYRPNPEALSYGYNTEGKYTSASGTTEDYPPAIAWLSLSYGGSVTE